MFDHEKLEVYQLQLQFIAWLTPVLADVRERESRLTREVTDQLDRASLSMLLNTAEGNGKRQRRLRAKFFDDARGSATECAACLDAVVAKGICQLDQVESGKVLLHRVVSMLTKLVARFDREGPENGESG
ncbi:MAG: four helix bundle protein [Planctomycetaceae bacterium]|nr:four helix bundle protein [Planctomycetaceae bacterium]